VGHVASWWRHPGIFILVTKGELTYYDYDDPECNGIRVPAGQGFVDDGHGHHVRSVHTATPCGSSGGTSPVVTRPQRSRRRRRSPRSDTVVAVG
jgi:hypothetical protein